LTAENYTRIVGKNIICDRREHIDVTADLAKALIGRTVIIFGPVYIPTAATLSRPFKLIDINNIDIDQTFRDKDNSILNLFKTEDDNLTVPVMDRFSTPLTLQKKADGITVKEFIFHDSKTSGKEGQFFEITRNLDGTIPYPEVSDDLSPIPRCHVIVHTSATGEETVLLEDNTEIPLVRMFDGSIPYPYSHDGVVVELQRDTLSPIMFVFDTNNNLQFANYDASGNLDMPVYFTNTNRLTLENIDYFREVLNVSLDKYIRLRELPDDSEETVGVKTIRNRMDLLDKVTELFELKVSDTVALENSFSPIVSEAYKKLYEQITVDETVAINFGIADGDNKLIYETFDDWFANQPDLGRLIEYIHRSDDVEEAFIKLAYDVIDAIAPLRTSKYVLFAKYSKKDYSRLRKLFIQLCTYYITFLGTEMSDVKSLRKDNLRCVPEPPDCYKDALIDPPLVRAGRFEISTKSKYGELTRYRQLLQLSSAVDNSTLKPKNPRLELTSVPTFGILFNVNDQIHHGDKVNYSCGFDENPECRYAEMLPCGFNEIEIYGG
jgi:hypothetical protein